MFGLFRRRKAPGAPPLETNGHVGHGKGSITSDCPVCQVLYPEEVRMMWAQEHAQRFEHLNAVNAQRYAEPAASPQA